MVLTRPWRGVLTAGCVFALLLLWPSRETLDDSLRVLTSTTTVAYGHAR